MDDANIVPLLISNVNYIWTAEKSRYPAHVQFLLDKGHTRDLERVREITQYPTLDERRAYCNLIDAEGYMTVVRARSLC